MTIKPKPFNSLISSALNTGKKAMSVRAFAKLAGCSAAHVSDCRTGNSAPAREEAERWASILDVDDVEGWLESAAMARARATTTGRDGAAAYEARIAALEDERAKQAQKIVQLIALAREAGLKIPKSLGG